MAEHPTVKLAKAPYRLLVTGSRDWHGRDLIRRELEAALDAALRQDRYLVVVHGGCLAGADGIADRWASEAGAEAERHPADWRRHGKAAGMIRNAEMVRLGADECLAFIRASSPGASHCAQLAEKAGIPVRRFTQ